MKARERLRAARKAALAVTAAGVLAATGGGVAEAATSSNLLYSTDGGASWSSSATVAPGQTVLVRQWYDNDTAASETGASLTTTIPGPFTLNGGSTQVCLNPSTTNPSAPSSTELVCEDAAEGAVWSGKDLQVSPIAGHYGMPNDQTAGVLPFGRKRYVNLQECRYRHPATSDDITRVVDVEGPNFNATSNASNTAGAPGSCGQAGQWGWDFVGQYDQSFDLLGNRYLNLQECRYRHSVANQDLGRVIDAEGPNFNATSNASNTAGAPGSCGPAGMYGWTFVDEQNQSFDFLTNRYLNLQECRYRRSTGLNNLTRVIDAEGPNFNATSNASNTAGAPGDCGPAGQFGWDLVGQYVQTFDLLDQARGHGYVQYAISAPDDLDAFCASNPSNPLEESYTQDGTLTSTPSGARASSGDLTIVWGDDPANPPCESSIPMVDPTVGMVAGGLAVVAGAAYVLHRRRVATI